MLSYEETIDDHEFNRQIEENGEASIKSKWVRLVPIKNYLNLIDKVSYTKLQQQGLKGVHYQIELPKSVGDYLDKL